MKRLKIVDIHRVYGKPFDPDSDDDDDDDAGNGGKENEENEENEEMEKSSGGELPGPHPMDGYRWQVECATPEDAKLLKKALFKGIPGRVVKNAAFILMMLIPSYETVIQTTRNIDDDKEKEERKEKEEEEEEEKKKGGKKKGGKKKNSCGKCDDNNKQENEKKEDEKDKAKEAKEKKTNPSKRASSPPPLPLPLPLPRVIPLLVEPETTTSYDMGAQVSVLTKTQQNSWWRVHPPELLSASRPLGPFYPISGACVYCGGPWQAAEGKKCRYHSSSKYLTNLILFKPYNGTFFFFFSQ